LPKERKKLSYKKPQSSASGSSSSSSRERKKSKEKILKISTRMEEGKTTMKWNNLAATDVITATKIATDDGGCTRAGELEEFVESK
jgi:hypothetical protein